MHPSQVTTLLAEETPGMLRWGDFYYFVVFANDSGILGMLFQYGKKHRLGVMEAKNTKIDAKVVKIFATLNHFFMNLFSFR